MSNKGVPYIGVTDFVSQAQVLEVLDCIPENIKRRLHVGIMTSFKVINGISTETGWEKIWLNKKQAEELFQPNERVFNVVHYADYSPYPAKTKLDDLLRACEFGGKYVDGLQLDMVWPEVGLLEGVKNKFPNLEIILQINRQAIAQTKENGKTLDVDIYPYSNFADYFLIDYSAGKGLPMNVPDMLDYIKEVTGAVPCNKISVGGGLGPNTYTLLQDIFEYSPVISCDAQGKMRSSNNITQPIEMPLVCGYVNGVCSLLLPYSDTF